MEGTCSVCSKRKDVQRSRKNSKLVCRACRRNDPSTHRQCFTCNDIKAIVSGTRTGKPICLSCYSLAWHHDPTKHKRCSRCGELKPVVTRTDTGKPICTNCYHRARYHDSSTHERCSGCETVKPVRTRTDTGEPICANCYRRSSVGTCADCRETKVIQSLGRCSRCYRHLRRARNVTHPA